MRPLRDPEKAELKHLLQACPLSGKSVLEIGCGDGIFMRQYARITHHVVGVDPLASELQFALQKSASSRYRNTHFLLGEAENLSFAGQSFEVVIFGSSL